jgi:aminopeptidase YwaD
MLSEPLKTAERCLKALCTEFGNRSVGSPGNLRATAWFRDRVAELGWEVESHRLSVVDWEGAPVTLESGDNHFAAFPSPYSMGCDTRGRIVPVSTFEELESLSSCHGLLLLHGEIAREQIMPKNFHFYNPPLHGKIVSLIEGLGPPALITATGRNSALAGGAYPFPLFEDGDLDVPSVFMTEEEGRRLLGSAEGTFRLVSPCRRIPSEAWNVIARRGDPSLGKVVITAHIDAKKGTPGAIDNATGVTVLLLLAEMLGDYTGTPALELVPFNGEDYYSVPGQMDYIERFGSSFENILLNINIDGAGFHTGETAFSLFDLPGSMERVLRDAMASSPGIVEGPLWPQGDHSIFLQYGIPALAVSSKWFIDNMETQDITHTESDNLSIVDSRRVVGAAMALHRFLAALGSNVQGEE